MSKMINPIGAVGKLIAVVLLSGIALSPFIKKDETSEDASQYYYDETTNVSTSKNLVQNSTIVDSENPDLIKYSQKKVELKLSQMKENSKYVVLFERMSQTAYDTFYTHEKTIAEFENYLNTNWTAYKKASDGSLVIQNNPAGRYAELIKKGYPIKKNLTYLFSGYIYESIEIKATSATGAISWKGTDFSDYANYARNYQTPFIYDTGESGTITKFEVCCGFYRSTLAKCDTPDALIARVGVYPVDAFEFEIDGDGFYKAKQDHVDGSTITLGELDYLYIPETKQEEEAE